MRKDMYTESVQQNRRRHLDFPYIGIVNFEARVATWISSDKGLLGNRDLRSAMQGFAPNAAML